MTTPTPADLAPTYHLDHDDPGVRAFALGTVAGLADDADRAAALFAAVRDGIWYDPYGFDLRPEALCASTVLHLDRAWCVPKAVLLAASCRAVGIPARLGFSDVRNHLSTPRLLELMGTDVFRWHGYAVLHLNDRWLKASPAFNAELCARFGVAPLDFDGTADALLHPYDGRGKRYMEYLDDHGQFDDLPFQQLADAMHTHYPDVMQRTDIPDDDPGFHRDTVQTR